MALPNKPSKSTKDLLEQPAAPPPAPIAAPAQQKPTVQAQQKTPTTRGLLEAVPYETYSDYPSPPQTLQDKLQWMPNSEKLTPSEKFLYGHLPGFSQSGVGKALEAFGQSPVGKGLGFLDILAEGFERTLGLSEQLRSRKPGEDFDLSAAWNAGHLFYETTNLPKLIYGPNPNAGKPKPGFPGMVEPDQVIIGMSVPTDLPGPAALADFRQKLAVGMTLDQVQEEYYNDIGALALRAQLNDTYGHILGDPGVVILGAIKPVERLHAIRELALAGKVDVQYVEGLAETARAAGRLEDAAEYAKVAKTIAAGETKAVKPMTALDKFAIALTGGEPWKGGKYTGWQQINPFALRPDARARELVSILQDNIGAQMIAPHWFEDPAIVGKELAAAKAGALGEKWGYLMLTPQGRATQGLLGELSARYSADLAAYQKFVGERMIIQQMADALGVDVYKIAPRLEKDPATLLAQLRKVSPAFANMSEEDLGKIAALIKKVPLTPEEFYAKIMVDAEDIATKQGILQFGVKPRGTLERVSRFAKAWESVAFIKGNPANAVRNVLGNEFTMIGRGVAGLTEAEVEAYVKKAGWMSPRFAEGFGLEGIAGETERKGSAAAAMMNEAQTGGKYGTLEKWTEAAGKARLGGLENISKWSANMEVSASKRAYVKGLMVYEREYYRPITAAEVLSADEIASLEQAMPGATQALANAARSAGLNQAELDKALGASLHTSAFSVIESASDELGYKAEQALDPEIIHLFNEGLPDAVKTGKVPEFIQGLKAKLAQNTDAYFDNTLKTLPGYISEQVRMGGHQEIVRQIGRALDEFWAGHEEDAIRMASSNFNDEIRAAEAAGSWDAARALWRKVSADKEHFYSRVYGKFDAVLEGIEQGAKNAGISVPEEVRAAFKNIREGWTEAHEFKRKEFDAFFDAVDTRKTPRLEWDELRAQVQQKYTKMGRLEDALYTQAEDAIKASITDPAAKQLYTQWRDAVGTLRQADREAVNKFWKDLELAGRDERPDLFRQFWHDRQARMAQMRSLEMTGANAIQGDARSVEALQSFQAPSAHGLGAPEAGEPFNVARLASDFGVPTQGASGARLDKRVIATVEKYTDFRLPEGGTMFDIPEDVARRAFEAQMQAHAGEALAKGADNKPFVADVTKLIPDPQPIDSAMNQIFFGRSEAALDAMEKAAGNQATKKFGLVSELPEGTQRAIQKWARAVSDDMSTHRLVATRFAGYKRDASLLNYYRRNNWDAWSGNAMPYIFWTSHSLANWAIESIDRPAMMAFYYRSRKLLETAGLSDPNMPSRVKRNIRIHLPFVPAWMGDQFVDPLRITLPFDALVSPIDQMYAKKRQTEGRATHVLDAMLGNGDISQAQYDDAIQTKSGPEWDIAVTKAESDDPNLNFDAWDFANTVSSPHAPLVWAYNAARGTPNEIGPFTPFSRGLRNLATTFGVKDWNNSPMNIEGKIRAELGLPRYDKWDTYRVKREISNMVADGVITLEEGNTASVTGSGPVWQQAVERANQEFSGGPVGTVLGILGIPVKSYPTGEQKQRALQDDFARAYDKYKKGDVKALNQFFDDHPEYESRLGLALWDKPEEQMHKFLIDKVWSQYNSLPDVNQRELRNQLGQTFEDAFINRDTRSYDSLNTQQLQVWLKLMGGDPPGTLSADQNTLFALLDRIELTEPETAWRAQVFYDTRTQDFPNFYDLQQKYYALPENKRKAFVNSNPELEGYWDWRRTFMNNNPDLVPLLTDNQALWDKARRRRRNPAVAVPTAAEIQANFPEPAQRLLQYSLQNDEPMPDALDEELDYLTDRYGLSREQLLAILGAPQPAQ